MEIGGYCCLIQVVTDSGCFGREVEKKCASDWISAARLDAIDPPRWKSEAYKRDAKLCPRDMMSTGKETLSEVSFSHL